jgi:hypothetical protein
MPDSGPKFHRARLPLSGCRIDDAFRERVGRAPLLGSDCFDSDFEINPSVFRMVFWKAFHGA